MPFAIIDKKRLNLENIFWLLIEIDFNGEKQNQKLQQNHSLPPSFFQAPLHSFISNSYNQHLLSSAEGVGVGAVVST